MICNVANCPYAASTTIEDFPVCALHDCKHVQAILEDLKRPGHFYRDSHPIVLPVGDLEVEHFAPISGDGKNLDECPQCAAIDFECHSFVLPRFDLTKEWSP